MAITHDLRHATRALACFATLVATAACGDTTPSPDMAKSTRPSLGAPLPPSPKGTWTWYDFPDSSCDDGSPTGIGVNPGDSPNLVLYLEGGGACWDYSTCFVLNTASKGPFGKAQFEQRTGGLPAGTLFDRTEPTNPVRDWTMVYIPYCTGDIHGGDNTVTYAKSDGSDAHTYHHAGHANLVAFLKRIAATWPAPPRAVFSGSSAGGFGASLNYDTFRTYYPAGKSYLVDDSGPPLIGGEIPQGFRDQWFKQWQLGKLLDPICGDCQIDLSLLVTTLGKKYPTDRMSLLSYTRDKTIRGYFLKTPEVFEKDLLAMAQAVIDPLPTFHYFFVAGESHTMLGAPTQVTSGGVKLQTFLTQQITDDPAWKSIKP